MPKLNIVLLSPEIPQNTGNISRTCAVTGASLHLIKPFGFEISDRTVKRAGLDYWDKLDLHFYENFEAFLAENAGAPLYFFTAKGARSFARVEYPDGVFLVFGRESVGLPEDLLAANTERTLRIPMLAGCRCLNLSNAVAVAAYEVLRHWNFEGMSEEGIFAGNGEK